MAFGMIHLVLRVVVILVPGTTIFMGARPLPNRSDDFINKPWNKKLGPWTITVAQICWRNIVQSDWTFFANLLLGNRGLNSKKMVKLWNPQQVDMIGVAGWKVLRDHTKKEQLAGNDITADLFVVLIELFFVSIVLICVFALFKGIFQFNFSALSCSRLLKGMLNLDLTEQPLAVARLVMVEQGQLVVGPVNPAVNKCCYLPTRKKRRALYRLGSPCSCLRVGDIWLWRSSLLLLELFTSVCKQLL